MQNPEKTNSLQKNKTKKDESEIVFYFSRTTTPQNQYDVIYIRP